MFIYLVCTTAPRPGSKLPAWLQKKGAAPFTGVSRGAHNFFNLDLCALPDPISGSLLLHLFEFIPIYGLAGTCGTRLD